MSAPADIRAVIMSTVPFCAAYIRAVLPSCISTWKLQTRERVSEAYMHMGED